VVVGRNYNLLRPDLSLGAFDFGWIRIVICPDFEVVTQACSMCGFEVINDDHLLVLVAIPPLIRKFDEMVCVCCSNVSTFTCSCGTIVPFVGEFVECGWILRMETVEGLTLFELGIIPNGNRTVFN